MSSIHRKASTNSTTASEDFRRLQQFVTQRSSLWASSDWTASELDGSSILDSEGAFSMDSLRNLTSLDKELLRKTWKIVSKDMELLAVDIFQMIFEQAPDAKLMFQFMQKDYREDEKKSNEFTFHALRFVQVIESTMLHLDEPVELDPVFLNLGKLHARHQEQLGFRPHYWSVFKECTLFHFRKAMKADRKANKKGSLTSLEIDSAIILWREVLRAIIERMKAGLEQNGLVRKANREILNGKDEDAKSSHSGMSGGAGSLGVQQISMALRRTELSVVVPDYFMRQGARSRADSEKDSISDNSFNKD